MHGLKHSPFCWVLTLSKYNLNYVKLTCDKIKQKSHSFGLIRINTAFCKRILS